MVLGKGFKMDEKPKINNLTTHIQVLSAETTISLVSGVQLSHSPWERLLCNIRNQIWSR